MALILITAGVLAGLVNYFYVYLNLPIERKKPDASLLEEGKPEWELPRLTYLLALGGYFVIGLAGSCLTPLINSIIGLKGLQPILVIKNLVDNDKWVLFGYGIVFGFSTNRLLSSIAESILARIDAILKAKDDQQRQQTEQRFKLSGKQEKGLFRDLIEGEHAPTISEIAACGEMTAKIIRGTPAFSALKTNNNIDIVFKDEEGTGADRMMNNLLFDCINTLASKVKSEWTSAEQPIYKLRVVEAWDEDNEHGANSLHYEDRAADLNLWDIKNNRPDTSKLSQLSGLAINSGFNWVFYEDSNHIHVSCKRT